MIHRLAIAGIAFLSSTLLAADASTDARAIVPNREPLAKSAFIRLPIGSVRAEGWLLRQLNLQKAGLTGSAEKLYDALTPDSGWLGGEGEAWEKSPYYVKGLIALAYTLDDAELKTRAQKWVDWSLQSQRPDGFFGPATNDDWWPRMVVLFYLRDYYEATGDARVLPFFTSYFRYQLANLPARPLKDWGKSRAGDNADVVLWLYNRTGDAFLLDLAKLLREQAYPWSSIFAENRFYDFANDFQPHHIVNVSQALKTPAVSWQTTKDDADKSAVAEGIAHLEKQYGRIDGQISGTEMLSGRRSTDGVELCADIERIISNTVAINAIGDASLGDSLEKVAYNSLPAHTSPRMRQITYYQLPNQIAATFGGHGFTQDYGNGNVPGPHSGFPCCCYNWHAGWPKFVESMWSATPDGGLAAIAYGPNHVTTTVAGGVPITITETTDYPFKETISLKIEPQKAATFPLALRVPAWCATPAIVVNGKAEVAVASGGFHRVEREWKTGDVVELKFPMAVRTSTWANNSVGIERGPLAYSLKIKEQWRRAKAYPGGFDEFEILPQSPWNYALQVDRAAPEIKVSTHDVPAVPFDTDVPPVVLTATAKRLPTWVARKTLGTVTLGRSDGGWKALADGATSLEPNVPHQIRVDVKGKAIRVFVDNADRPIIEQDDETFASGGIGLRTYGTAAKFDDVKLDGDVLENFNGGAANWQTFGGKWTIRNGAYNVDAAKDGKAILQNRNDLRDFTLEATITLKPGGDAGVLFRVKNAAEQLDAYHGYYVGLSAREGQSHDAEEPPQSPVTSNEPAEKVDLIPFGSTKLRVSYFPVLSER